MTRCVPLAELTEINPPLRESLPDDTPVAFVPMASLSAERAAVDVAEVRRCADVRKGYTPFHDGDLLVAKITPCFENGKIAEARLPQRAAFGSSEFHVLRPDSSVVNSRYLLRYLRQDSVRLAGERRMTGSAGQRRVPEAFFRDLAVPLPPLAEQRRIADILDRADEMRAKRREAIALLESLSGAAYLELFGDPPRRWPVAHMGDVIDGGPQNGLYKPSTDYGSGTLILRIDGFYDGKVTAVEGLKRVRVTDRERELYALTEGEIVINRVNSREYLGKSALVPALSEPVLFESNMMRFAVDRSRVEPGFVVAFLQTAHAKSQILARAKDAINQSSINQQDVRGLSLPVPPIDVQREFARRLEAIEALKAAHRTSLAEMDALFASLQHRAFRGEL